MDKTDKIILSDGTELAPIHEYDGLAEKFKQQLNDPSMQNYMANQIQNQIKNNLKQDSPKINNNPLENTEKLLKQQLQQSKSENEELQDNLCSLTDQLSSMQKEMANQTKVIQTLRYDNMKQIAQIEVLNKTNDMQLSEISELKENEIISKNKIASLNQTISKLENDNRYQGIKSFLSGIVVTVIGGIIVWFITAKVI
jgi:hypothetical protein